MQTTLDQLSRQQLETLESGLNRHWQELKQSSLALDLTRGKPGPEQLDLSNSLDGILHGHYTADDGIDVRKQPRLQSGLVFRRVERSGVLFVFPNKIEQRFGLAE